MENSLTNSSPISLNKNLFASLLLMGTALTSFSNSAEADVILCQPTNLPAVPCASNSGGTIIFDGTISSGSVTIVPSGTQTVNGTVINGAGTADIGTIHVAGTVPVLGTVALSGTSAVTIQNIPTVVVSGTSTIVPSGTQSVNVLNHPSVTVDGTIALSGTSPVNGNVGIVPVTSGGLSVKNHLVLNNITAVTVDASPGQLYGIEAFNNGVTIAYIKMYDAAQGSVTCGGTLTPKSTHMIPAPAIGGGGFISMNMGGVAYSTAITACITTGFANNDTAAPAASTYMINFLYK